MPFHTTNNISVRFSASFENRFVVCFYYNIECFSCLAAGNKNLHAQTQKGVKTIVEK